MGSQTRSSYDDSAAIIYERRKFDQEVTLPNSNFLLATSSYRPCVPRRPFLFTSILAKCLQSAVLKISGKKKRKRFGTALLGRKAKRKIRKETIYLSFSLSVKGVLFDF